MRISMKKRCANSVYKVFMLVIVFGVSSQSVSAMLIGEKEAEQPAVVQPVAIDITHVNDAMQRVINRVTQLVSSGYVPSAADRNYLDCLHARLGEEIQDLNGGDEDLSDKDEEEDEVGEKVGVSMTLVNDAMQDAINLIGQLVASGYVPSLADGNDLDDLYAQLDEEIKDLNGGDEVPSEEEEYGEGDEEGSGDEE